MNGEGRTPCIARVLKDARLSPEVASLPIL